MKPAPNKRRNPSPGSSFGIQDILFVLFKHKWKIIILSLLGVASAGAIAYKSLQNPTFETQAKLLVRYVQHRNAVDAYETRSEADGRRGAAVMDAELEILLSTDIMMNVAEEVGPEKLISGAEGDPKLSDAAIVILKSLKVSVTRGSNVIHLSYTHPDPEVSVEVLKAVIDEYFTKHLEIHRSTDAFEVVSRQADSARSKLRSTEEEIKDLKAESGVASVLESMAALETRRNLIRESLLTTDAEMVQQKVKVEELEKVLGLDSVEEGGDLASEEEEIEEDPKELAAKKRASAEALTEYRDLGGKLEVFKNSRNQMLISRPPTDRRIKELERKIDEIEKRGLDLLEQHPELANMGSIQGGRGNGEPGAVDIGAERALLASLAAKRITLESQSKMVESEFQKLSEAAAELMDLERRRAMQEDKYEYYETSLGKARVDETLNPANMPNIDVLQQPSAPLKAIDDKVKKVAIGLAVGGLALGLGLAFLIEFVLDRKVSRPMEIQTRLQLPLMMSIPYVRSKDNISTMLDRERGLQFLGTSADVMSPPQTNGSDSSVAVPEESEHFISRYAEAVRDRVVFNFEVNNITHKPKLVALAGLTPGAGASTIAAGMAMAFANEGKSKVLYVDLNPASEGRNGFQRDPSSSLVNALKISKSERFRQSDRNLYFASALTQRNDRGSRSLAPMELNHLMPEMNASDFDYIIFDLPPLDPTSPTLTMAGFMDKVLLVVDAEKTTKDRLQWGYSELESSRVDVSCIYNKAKTHAPKWVQGGV